MKLNIMIFLLMGILLISGCSQNDAQNTSLSENLVDKDTKIDTEVGGAKVEVENGTAKVEYEDKTVIAENVSLTVNGEGTYEINLSVKNNLTLPPEMPIEQWCIVGQTYDVKGQDGATSYSTIQGIEQYKDKIYCKAKSNTQVYGMEVLTIYYFDYGAKDVWALVSVGDQTNEIHINNN